MFLRRTRLSSNVGALCLVLLAVTTVASTGCSSSEGRSSSELNPGGGDGGSLGSGASGNGSGGVDLGNGSGGDGSTAPNGKTYCQDAAVDFVPQVATVYVLVDQSGSIYDQQQWVPLRDAVLPVIQQLQADVRFGFGSYTGTQQNCPGLDDLGTIALNNYDAIAAKYNGLPTSPQPNQETPTIKALGQVIDILKADTGAPGPRAILLVTADDDNDFCDNANRDCGNDALIATLQMAAADGIKTFIFGLDNSGIQDKVWFDYWAQAGQGELPNWPKAQNITQYNGDIYDACNGVTPWKEIWTAQGRSGFNPAGSYSTEGGTAKAFLNADTNAVATEIGSKVESLKSCIFDLGDNVEVKEGAMGDIFVDEVEIPDDQWKMNSPTVLELLGQACDDWKKPEVTKFFAGFACDALIIK